MKKVNKVINEAIKQKDISLIDSENVLIEQTDRATALQKAANEGMDLVLISTQNNVAICKICNASKYFYEIEKNTKKVSTSEVKEIKFTLKTDKHDIETKCNNIKRILEDGDRAKLSINVRKIRRKEKEKEDFAENCKKLLVNIAEHVSSFAKIDSSDESSITISLKTK